MKTQELTANGIDRAFLEKLVGEMNDLVPDDQQLEARHDAAYKSERAHKKIELQRILLREDSVHREMWRDYWKGERDYINGLFRALARDGQLPKDDVSDLLYFCDHLVKYNMRTGIRDGRPVAEPVPIFEGAFAKAAYTLVLLAGGQQLGYRVVGCKHCGKLSVAMLGKKGRPRSDFCSLKHGLAYAQAAKRRRDKGEVAQATKHK